jgi:drug/metabolite transporter (DMT)-like permease
VTAVLIWGSTFFAIRFQLGEVDPAVSVAYRFALAALMLLGWCRWRGLSLRFSAREHGFIALQGLLLFCLNYLIIYFATGLLTSGLVAVIFSGIVFMNIANGALLFRQPVAPRVVLGALFGLAGISQVFWPELASASLSDDTLKGIGLALLATYIASLGNVISARNQRAGIPVMQSNAWGMTYGALFMTGLALVSGLEFGWDARPGYAISLLYLALLGSVLAFGAYLTLVGRIGADRAAYATVVFPLVALALSTAFESYQWTPQAVAGIALVLIGNLLVLAPSRAPKLAAAASPSR